MGHGQPVSPTGIFPLLEVYSGKGLSASMFMSQFAYFHNTLVMVEYTSVRMYNQIITLHLDKTDLLVLEKD